MSKWLRSSIKNISKFGDSVNSLKEFFALLAKDPPVRPPTEQKKTPPVSQTLFPTKRTSPPAATNKNTPQKKHKTDSKLIQSFFKQISTEERQAEIAQEVASMQEEHDNSAVMDDVVLDNVTNSSFPSAIHGSPPNGVLLDTPQPSSPIIQSTYFSSSLQVFPSTVSSPTQTEFAGSSPQGMKSQNVSDHAFPSTAPTSLLCKRCQSVLVTDCSPIIFTPRKSYFKRIDMRVRDTSVPKVILSGDRDPPAYLVPDSALSDTNCYASHEPPYASVTFSELYKSNHIGAPLHNQQIESSIWIPQDGIVYIPLFCNSCKPPWVVGCKIKATDQQQAQLCNQIWISQAAVTEKKAVTP